ncbi:MAG: phage protease, partial [Pseudomonadales bacterium]
KWNERARDFISAGEYRYLSAVFPYDKSTGQPLALHSAALVNRPGVDGMATAALRAATLVNQPSEDKPMNETLRKLLAVLGIELDASATELTEEQSTAALSALNDLSTQAKKVAGLETNIAALKAQGTDVDLSQYVPVATYNSLVTEFAALKAGDDKKSAKSLIDAAQTEGKVLAAEVEYLTQFSAQQGVAALKEMLDKRPAVAALSAPQTSTTPVPAQPGIAALSADEKEAARISGMSEQDYIAAKAKQ